VRGEGGGLPQCGRCVRPWQTRQEIAVCHSLSLESQQPIFRSIRSSSCLAGRPVRSDDSEEQDNSGGRRDGIPPRPASLGLGHRLLCCCGLGCSPPASSTAPLK
jgi:hypothetical protein